MKQGQFHDAAAVLGDMLPPGPHWDDLSCRWASIGVIFADFRHPRRATTDLHSHAWGIVSALGGGAEVGDGGSHGHAMREGPF